MNVLVAGGGLVGLSTAVFLGQHGVRTTVVERHATTSIHPKARGFTPRTMELFRGAGFADEVREAGAALKDNHDLVVYETLDKPPLRRIMETTDNEPILRVSPDSHCACPQDALEPILLAAARELGADIRFGTEFQSFTQDHDGVTAIVDGATIRADYLVACDGSRSSIRERLGIDMVGDAPTMSSVGISFEAELDLDHFILAWTTHPDGAGILLPIDNRRRWVFHVELTGSRTPADFTDEYCTRLIRVATGQPDLDVKLVSVAPWETTSAVAAKYRAGRVFLAGDAAHLIPPAGAFGANTGIQDAHNLAWKLAYVLNGMAGPALLDTYEAERRPVAEMTTDQAMRRWQTWMNHNPMPFAEDLAVMYGTQYVSSAVDHPGPARPLELNLDGTPGTRVPHAWLPDGRSTLDLVGPDFALLHDGTWPAGPVRSHQVDLGPGAMLVRPDGYVAWRSTEPTDVDPIMAKLLTR
ncbi:FAD-dependent monooxygenase [Actinocrispum wychmicini]|uniref:Putative polyketide hydroxylase n=1 Tax=Actinocrispum wychmicini TaxID=1213861 RepID=A0A4R2K7I0_9PSEU|nr:FAD-dependent monooxygenase [Actinocrispum wychmicini]TCO65909.1 putative polyketide hydroxylase [Actinocrispum wychmicini]